MIDVELFASARPDTAPLDDVTRDALHRAIFTSHHAVVESRVEVAVHERAGSSGSTRRPDVVPLDAAVMSGQRRPRLLAAAALLIVAATGATLVGLGARSANAPAPSDTAGETTSIDTTTPDVRPVEAARSIHRSVQDDFVVVMATEVLRAECMNALGFTYVPLTEDEMIHSVGGWLPDDLLGVRSVVGAQRFGYQMLFLTGAGSTTQVAALEAMAPNQRDAYVAASDSCSVEARTQLDDLPDGDLPAAVNRLVAQPLLWANDNDTAAAVEEWQACVETTTGQQAATPNELARRYAVLDRQTTAPPDEIDIAVADATCQVQTHLQHTFAGAIVEHERQLMGSDVVVYDELVALRSLNVMRARAMLEERGIVAIELNPFGSDVDVSPSTTLRVTGTTLAGGAGNAPRVLIANASTTNGIASMTTSALQNGFPGAYQLYPATNGQPMRDTSIVYFAPGFEVAGNNLAAALEIVDVAPMPAVLPVEGAAAISLEAVDLLVVLGTDRDDAGGSSG